MFIDWKLYLKTSPFAAKMLIVSHSIQYFLMATGHQARSAQNFQNRDFRFYIFSLQTLSDGVNGCRMGEHVSTTGLKIKIVGIFSAEKWKFRKVVYQ